MATTHHIAPEHLPRLARLQHVLEYLNEERARLEAELQHVIGAGQRKQNELFSFLQHAYGIDAQHTAMTLDVDKGVVMTPDAPAEAAEAPEVIDPHNVTETYEAPEQRQ